MIEFFYLFWNCARQITRERWGEIDSEISSVQSSIEFLSRFSIEDRAIRTEEFSSRIWCIEEFHIRVNAKGKVLRDIQRNSHLLCILYREIFLSCKTASQTPFTALLEVSQFYCSCTKETNNLLLWDWLDKSVNLLFIYHDGILWLLSLLLLMN